jgi:hypothetical protein
MAAVETHHDRSESSPIHEYQRLLPIAEAFLDGLQGRAGKATFQGAAADIQQFDGWGSGVSGPFFESDQGVFARQGIVV